MGQDLSVAPRKLPQAVRVVGRAWDITGSFILRLQTAFWPHRAQLRAINELRDSGLLRDAEPAADPWRVTTLHAASPTAGPVRVTGTATRTDILGKGAAGIESTTNVVLLNGRVDFGVPYLNRCMHVLLTRWADLDELHAVIGRDGLTLLQPPGDTFAVTADFCLADPAMRS